jgi:hypothetical protein
MPPEDLHEVPLDAYLAVNCTREFSTYTLHRTMELEMTKTQFPGRVHRSLSGTHYRLGNPTARLQQLNPGTPPNIASQT